MKGVEVIDNFLPEEVHDEIYMAALGRGVPWRYNDYTLVANKDDEEDLNNFQFVHGVYRNHKIYSEEGWLFVQPILRVINPTCLLRIKFNLRPRAHEITYQDFHTDNKYKQSMTGIYYVNTCDGYTEFENGFKVETVENRFLSFPSKYKHRGTNTTNAKCRVVFNFNWFDLELFEGEKKSWDEKMMHPNY